MTPINLVYYVAVMLLFSTVNHMLAAYLGTSAVQCSIHHLWGVLTGSIAMLMLRTKKE